MDTPQCTGNQVVELIVWSVSTGILLALLLAWSL